MKNYRIIKIKKVKNNFKNEKLNKRILLFLREKWKVLLLFGGLSSIGIGTMIYNIVMKESKLHESDKIKLNMKIENLEIFKREIMEGKPFSLNDIDKYIKDNFLNEEDIMKIYSNINNFSKDDQDLFKNIQITSIDELLNNETPKDSWYEKYLNLLKENNTQKIEEEENWFDNFYNSNTSDHLSEEENVANYYKLEIINLQKDIIWMNYELENLFNSNYKNKKEIDDMKEGISFIKNLQYNYLINFKWYRLLAFSFEINLTSEHAKEKEQYFLDLKSIYNSWLKYSKNNFFDFEKNKPFWEVDGYNGKDTYNVTISKDEIIDKVFDKKTLVTVLENNKFFDQFIINDKQFNINDFWIKYNNSHQLEKKNIGTDEEPKWMYRYTYDFTFRLKETGETFTLKLDDNNFRVLSLKFDIEIKYADIFESYQEKYFSDLTEQKQSWMILFDLVY